MGRLNRFQWMERNKSAIIESFHSFKTNIFSFAVIAGMLLENKANWALPNATTVNDFLKFLKENNIILEIELKGPRPTVRYIFGDTSVFDIALSLNRNAYLTHFTAVFLHGLTNNVAKNIYTNVEQARKSWGDANDEHEEEMEQKNIDLAFSRPMRKTNQIMQFDFNGLKHQVYLLNGKNHDGLGVKEVIFEDKRLSVTDIERTLVDIVVRPDYAGGIEEVLSAFVAAKGMFSVNKLLATLRKMKYRYPYHQLIGFYLERAGYDEKLLKLVDQFQIKYNFYLTYQMKEKEFSERWKVYYPKDFAKE